MADLGLTPTEIVLSFVYTGVALGVFGAVVIYSIVRWSFTRTQLRRASYLALVIIALGLPMNILNVMFMEVTQFERLGMAGVAGRVFLASSTFITVLLTAAYHILKVPVIMLAGTGRAEGRDDLRPPFPLLSGGDDRFGGWVIGSVIGLVAGALSSVAFWLLDVQPGKFLADLVANAYPDVNLNRPDILLLVILPAVLGVAMAEELVFRGLIQRWLHRWLGDARWAPWIAIVIASLIWSMGHAVNTDAILAKLGQTFIIGIAFGWLALRYSVEAAMVGHVGLNFSAVIAGFLMETQ